MDDYMVTIADREGKDSRVLVRVPSSNTVEDVTEFISRPGVRSTEGKTLEHPFRVVGVRKLHIRRPVTNTVWPTVQKASV